MSSHYYSRFEGMPDLFDKLGVSYTIHEKMESMFWVVVIYGVMAMCITLIEKD